ncbi:HTH domain-containing protein [Haloterrigena salifodinae]|uniref:HTH domain-containing protein n=1 Tax=Haloterrigena salifodinae TaxID=2675099 RepID=UPI0020130A52|nr:HTH domain-containing protein [Haloterrigena salifodinae]
MGLTPREFNDYLKEIGVTALRGAYRSFCIEVADGSVNAELHLPEYTRQLGTGHSPLGPGFSSEEEDIRGGALPILREADETLTVAVVIDGDFTDPDETKASYRNEVISFIVDLASACDVTLVAESQIVRTFLWKYHRDQLPASVESQYNPSRRDRLSSAEIDEKVTAAVDELGEDSKPVKYLRMLNDEASQTLTYDDFVRETRVSRETVRYHVSQKLVPLGLVDRTEWYGEAAITLTHVGEEYLDVITRQSRLTECVESTPNSSLQGVCTQPPQDCGEKAAPYRTEYYSRAKHAAAAASATENGISLVKEPADWGKNDRIRWVSYDEDKDEAVVAVRATGEYEYLVGTALALSHPKLLNKALTVNRLEEIVEEVPDGILRDARNLGISDEALDNPSEFRDAIVARGEEIEDLTTKAENSEQRSAIRGKIMRWSHGLASAVVHLLDLAGVDLVREIHLPEKLDAGRHYEPLAESIARSAAIQSTYADHYVGYRQLYEDRDEKRQRAIMPEIDASTPVGSLIGSFVIRGKDVHRFAPVLKQRLERPVELHEDAPEFNIEIPVREECGREAFEDVTARILWQKGMHPTQSVVSLLHGLVGSPYDAAQALSKLGNEDATREIRPDELRYGLATLGPVRILPDMAPSVSSIVYTLLCAEKRLPQKELAERADVSAQTIRNHRDKLEALGLLHAGEDGYRLLLSFRTREERQSPVTPEFVDMEFMVAIDALLEGTLPPGRYGDPDDPIGGVLFWPPETWMLLNNDRLCEWTKLAAALTGTEISELVETVTMGPEIEQTAITEPTEAIA